MQKTWKTSSSVLSCFRMFLSRNEVITELYRLSQDTWSRPWTSKVDSIFFALRALIKPRPQNSFTIFAHLEYEQKYLPTLNVYQLVANSCLLLILKIPCSRSSHSAGARALQRIWNINKFIQHVKIATNIYLKNNFKEFCPLPVTRKTLSTVYNGFPHLRLSG